MTNPNGPRLTVCAAASEIEVAAGIDRKILELAEFACGEVDSKSFGNGPEIENQRAKQRDRLPAGIQTNVPIADGTARFEIRADGLPGTILLVEASRLHGVADGGIERAAALLRDRQRKLDRFIQDRADRNGDADLRRELSQFAPRLPDPAKPFKRALDCCLPMDCLLRIRSAPDHVDGHEGPHQSDGAEVIG